MSLDYTCARFSLIIIAVELFANNWQLKRDGEDFVLCEFIFNNESYANKYDEIQKTIHELSGIDDLLAGKPCNA